MLIRLRSLKPLVDVENGGGASAPLKVEAGRELGLQP